jgi:hypothetical protein
MTYGRRSLPSWTEPVVLEALGADLLGPLDLTAAVSATDAGPLAARVAAAEGAAVKGAVRRLERWMSPEAVQHLPHYFRETVIDGSDAFPALDPDFELPAFIEELAVLPRSVYSPRLGAGAQIELRTLDGPSDGTPYGACVEPDSPAILLSPTLLTQALDAGLSVGIRQFDRQFIRWAPVADDLTTVAKADIFCKLFVAGGSASVTDWHRDRSDILVTMLSGFKHFAIAPASARDGAVPEPEVVAELRPGWVLQMPRARLHCATPSGDVSALLTISIMRHGDWAFAGAVPTHLGYASVPTTARTYGLALRSHLPMSLPAAASDPDRCWRSRAPGGLAVLDERQGEADIAAQGQVFRLSADVLAVLEVVHAHGPISACEVRERVASDADSCEAALAMLAARGLVTAC